MKNFKNKFKELRKNYDLTQEQVAEIFSVSPQAISRWEVGINYPDIEILPHIAIFFKTTVDDLLGVENLRKEENVRKYIKEARNLLNSGKTEEALEILKGSIKEYPVNYNLQSLFVQGLITKYNSLNEKDDLLKTEIITKSESIINYCSDQNIVSWVKFLLFRQHIKWNEKKAAEIILKTLPSEVWYTQEVNIGLLLEGKEWIDNQELCITRFNILLCDFIKEYAYKGDLDEYKKIECLKLAREIRDITQQVVKPDKRDNYIEDVFSNINIAILYLNINDANNALYYIEKATEDSLNHLTEMNNTNDDGSNYFAWGTKRNLAWILLEDYLNKTNFDVIRDDPRFIKCFEILQSNVNELK